MTVRPGDIVTPTCCELHSATHGVVIAHDEVSVVTRLIAFAQTELDDDEAYVFIRSGVELVCIGSNHVRVIARPYAN